MWRTPGQHVQTSSALAFQAGKRRDSSPRFPLSRLHTKVISVPGHDSRVLAQICSLIRSAGSLRDHA